MRKPRGQRSAVAARAIVRATLTQQARWWHVRAADLPFVVARADEDVSCAFFHVVERSDVRYAAVDLALWRVRRRGRVREPLLPHQGRQDRSDAGTRAAMGDLQRPRRSLDRAAILARLAASHRRRAADRGQGHAAAMVEAAPAQPHGYARRPSSDRLDPGAGPQAESDRRLQGLDAGPVSGTGTGVSSKSFWLLSFQPCGWWWRRRKRNPRPPIRRIPVLSSQGLDRGISIFFEHRRARWHDRSAPPA